MGLFDKIKVSGHPFTSAVILAAGAGQRFSDIAGEKQNREIFGIPVAVRALTAFEKCGLVDEIVLVCRTEDRAECETIGEKFGISKLKAVVCGGKTRMESALAGFERTSDKSKFTAIHDGARCLITPEMIDMTLRAAYEHGAAAAGHISYDTVKFSESGEFIDETVDRSKVWLIGTPQVFMSNMYRASVYMAKKDRVEVTDDCMMAERLGFKIKLVDVGNENLKITTSGDIHIAEGILRGRGESD